MATNNEKLQELSVEEKLQHLYELQRIDTEIDKIKTLRGELPLEVQDLEDEIAGLETRLENLKNEISEADKSVTNKKQEITKSEELIKKYSEQLDNVRNNREYDALTKEVEFQKLEIELQQKRIRGRLFGSHLFGQKRTESSHHCRAYRRPGERNRGYRKSDFYSLHDR